ncbi:MAG: carboxypeptidase-like regulatory domain-containing protein [Reichenbachiella sp.]|uniref:carboxypeptidase-like regulatory domain-containing protein n=1 Tax=Reichenbachiella sp. TaxID=2184521 RepID=UPI003263E20C
MRTIIAVLVCIVQLTMYSNGLAATIRINGLVVDSLSGVPLPFAHVLAENVGVTTNADGVFSINVSDEILPPKLTVKYIGYESYRVEVEDVDKDLVLRMKPSVDVLEEVFVLTADRVISNVNAYRQINYEYNDMLLTAFYKESVSANEQMAYLAEGVFDIYLPTVYSSNQVELEVKKTRKKTFIDLDSIHMLYVTGHASDMINGSMRRDHSFLDLDEMKNYTYWKEGISFYDGEEVYIIGFKPARKKGMAAGTLYITTESNALIRAEYYPVISHQHFWTHVKWVEEYVQLNSTWLLKQVLYEGSWRAQENQYAFEAILDISTFSALEAKPAMTNTISENAIFFDSADELEEDFWSQHNYVGLSKKELAAIKEAKKITSASAKMP